MQVLQHVPPDSVGAVVECLAPHQAVCLSAPFMTSWVIASAPHIDLQMAELSPSQWCIFTAALLHTPPSAVTSLHLSAGSKLKDLATQFSTQTVSRCDGCALFDCGSPEERIDVVSDCVHCNSKCTRGVADMTATCQQLNLVVEQDHMQVLGAAQVITAHTCTLQLLGLHNLDLTPHLLEPLHRLLGSLPDTVTQLKLTTCKACGDLGVFGVHEKKQFFRAVAQVRSLRELHMPQCAAFVGGDIDKVSSCVEPLQSMAKLKIFVPQVGKTSAFSPNLTFHAIGQATSRWG